MADATCLVVKVRYRSGTYIARAPGKVATCTMCAKSAAQRLARKLWGDGNHDVAFDGAADDIEYFEITKAGADHAA